MKIFILLHVGICYNKMTNICHDEAKRQAWQSIYF